MKKPIPNLRWWIAGLVFLSTVINYIDRQTLAQLAPLLKREFQISNTEYGYISQAFLIPYTAMYLGAGLLIDRYGTKLVYGVAAAWWSAAAMLHATASSVLGFGVFRFLLGTAESSNFIAAEKVAAEWYPPKDRGTLNGWVQAGAVTGAIVTPILVMTLTERFGWRAAFVVTGALGLVWVALWTRVYHLPERHPRITPEELALIQSDSDANKVVSEKTPWPVLLRLPEIRGLLLARIFSDPVWWFYLFWLPKYLTEAHGLSDRTMSYVVWIPYLAADAGSILGGWCSGRLIAGGRAAVSARKLLLLASVALMPLGMSLIAKPSVPLTIIILCVVLFGHMSWKTNLATLTVDLFPRRIVASVHGLVATGSGIGGALFTAVAGHLIDWKGYAPVGVIMGVLHPIAYLCVRWLVRENPARGFELAQPLMGQTGSS